MRTGSAAHLAALRAGEEWPMRLGDAAFALECRKVFEKGRHAIDESCSTANTTFNSSDRACQDGGFATAAKLTRSSGTVGAGKWAWVEFW